MEELIRMFGALKFLLTDNGSEFIAKTLVRWLKDQDVQSRFIVPGSPWQSGRSERFNGTLRNEFLNQEAFHFWSLHSGGGHFAFVDGSVRFMAYSANSILPALASRSGGETQILE